MNIEEAKKLAEDILSGTTKIPYVKAARDLAEFVAGLEPGVNVIEITDDEKADTLPPAALQPYETSPSVVPVAISDDIDEIERKKKTHHEEPQVVPPRQPSYVHEAHSKSPRSSHRPRSRARDPSQKQQPDGADGDVQRSARRTVEHARCDACRRLRSVRYALRKRQGVRGRIGLSSVARASPARGHRSAARSTLSEGQRSLYSLTNTVPCREP